MRSELIDLPASLLLLIGGLFLVIGGVGLLRFPDFLVRIHAAGVCETLGTFTVLLGLMLVGAGWLVTVKLMLILVFLMITSPVSSHALCRAALHDGTIRDRVAKGVLSWKR
ncbi:MAG TPA: monovalent cation/H(+) antiporter subunit G [Candidatus Acidoferrales bacterium]|nr:monovalent cation/H(+) antiporter subunit G [Candidatus Acidoferrales bacterium]